MIWHLLIVDIQTGFAPHIADWESICKRASVMIEAAKRLRIPMTVTEQNPSKLGGTTPEIAELIQNVPIISKLEFSSLRVREVRERIESAEPLNLLIAGIETHVCILQTVLDAINNFACPITPYLLIDAIGSRRPIDRETALRRLETAGAVLTTVESAIFEFLEKAGTDDFKKILPLVK